MIDWHYVEVRVKGEHNVQIGEICFRDFVRLTVYGDDSLKETAVFEGFKDCCKTRTTVADLQPPETKEWLSK